MGTGFFFFNILTKCSNGYQKCVSHRILEAEAQLVFPSEICCSDRSSEICCRDPLQSQHAIFKEIKEIQFKKSIGS